MWCVTRGTDPTSQPHVSTLRTCCGDHLCCRSCFVDISQRTRVLGICHQPKTAKVVLPLCGLFLFLCFEDHLHALKLNPYVRQSPSNQSRTVPLSEHGELHIPPLCPKVAHFSVYMDPFIHPHKESSVICSALCGVTTAGGSPPKHVETSHAMAQYHAEQGSR